MCVRAGSFSILASGRKFTARRILAGGNEGQDSVCERLVAGIGKDRLHAPDLLLQRIAQIDGLRSRQLVDLEEQVHSKAVFYKRIESRAVLGLGRRRTADAVVVGEGAVIQVEMLRKAAVPRGRNEGLGGYFSRDHERLVHRIGAIRPEETREIVGA